MMDTKIFLTLVGLAVAIAAICKSQGSSDVREGFWGNPSRTVKVMRAHKPMHGPAYSLPGNVSPAQIQKGSFVSTPSFQSNLSPRFGSVDYGANIRYNMPSYKNQAVPCDPLAAADMVKEDYGCGKGCASDSGVAKCGKGGVSLGAPLLGVSHGDHISHEPSYVSAMNKAYKDHSAGDVADDGIVAVSDMTTTTASGQIQQGVTFDRLVFANQQSRLRSQGDPIRGDLAIPRNTCNVGWFRVSANPSVDLQQGALSVIGGVTNKESRDTADMLFNESGGYNDFGPASTGVDMSMSNQFKSSLQAGLGDLQVTAFP